MAASFTSPPVKKPTTAFPPRRGKIKAQIFEGIAETVASAASRAGGFLGLIKKDDGSAPAGCSTARHHQEFRWLTAEMEVLCSHLRFHENDLYFFSLTRGSVLVLGALYVVLFLITCY